MVLLKEYFSGPEGLRRSEAFIRFASMLAANEGPQGLNSPLSRGYFGNFVQTENQVNTDPNFNVTALVTNSTKPVQADNTAVQTSPTPQNLTLSVATQTITTPQNLTKTEAVEKESKIATEAEVSEAQAVQLGQTFEKILGGAGLHI